MRIRGTTTNIAGAIVDAAIGGQVKASAMTGVNGIYTIGALPYGACTVTAHKQGYIRQIKSTTISAGQTAHLTFNLDASGRLTGQVREKGTTTNIEGATVTAYLGGKAQATAITAANGIYVMDADLPAGTYTVRGAKAGYSSQTKTGMAVTAGSTTPCSFNLERAPSIRGQVRVAGTTAPIAGASIAAYLGSGLEATATSDSNGLYAIPFGLPAGAYRVTASRAGYMTQLKTGIAVTPGVTALASFNLQLSGILRGQVKDKVSGAPLIGATVKAYLSGVLRGTANTTAPNGVYEINANLPAGSYRLTASQAGYITQLKTGMVVTAGATTLVSFNLQPQ